MPACAGNILVFASNITVKAGKERQYTSKYLLWVFLQTRLVVSVMEGFLRRLK